MNRTEPVESTADTNSDEDTAMRRSDGTRRTDDDGAGWRRPRSRPLAILLTLLVAGSTACDSLLEVDLPGRVVEDDLGDPSMAATLVSGALGEFECALNQLVPTNGLLTGEFISSNFFLSSNAWGRYERPFMLESPGACPDDRATAAYGYYTPFERARWMAEDAARRIEEFPDEDVPNKAEYLAQLNAYAGYSILHLAQNYCEITVDNGPILSRSEALGRAEERFSEAIQRADASGDASIRNMALVGRARARLSAGNAEGAAADAEQVEEGFVRNASYSTASVRRENSTYNRTDTNYLSVGPAWRNLTVDGEPDPRVRVVDTGAVGQDGSTPQWDQMKYTARSDPIRIASWAEAQLIIAEARGGSAAIEAMNRVRATHEDLPPLDEADVDDVLATVLEERRREFFLEGQRHSDMIRHGIQFQTGENHKGQLFQDYECMPLPNVERDNNPNTGG